MKYTIKKGKHYNQSKVRFLLSIFLGIINGEVLRRTFLLRIGRLMARFVYFPKEAWYPIEAVEKTGWNKLFGFGGFNIHKYSARLVWQPNFAAPGWIEICLYVYNNGSWTATPITEVKTHPIMLMHVKREPCIYEGLVWPFRTIKLADKTPSYIQCEPYFGGQSTAPHDITIRLYFPWYYKMFKKRIHHKLGVPMNQSTPK
jgi:hypothetical protein